MPAEYAFEKRSVIILFTSMLFLLVLVYFLGLLTGLAMDRSEPANSTQLKAVEASQPKTQEADLPKAENGKSQKSDLSKETELKPVTPEFKEVSPQAEQPRISQPKKE